MFGWGSLYRPAARLRRTYHAAQLKSPPRSFLTVHRPDGRRVVVATDAEQLSSVRSGQRVRVGGRWMKHPGRSQADEDGPAEPVNDGWLGCRGAKRCMRAGTISRLDDITTPTWQQESSDTGEPSVANAPRGQYPPALARVACARSFVSVPPLCGRLLAVLCVRLPLLGRRFCTRILRAASVDAAAALAGALADGLDSAMTAELSPDGITASDASGDSTGGAARKLMQTTPPLVANPSIIGSSIKALFIPSACSSVVVHTPPAAC